VAGRALEPVRGDGPMLVGPPPPPPPLSWRIGAIQAWLSLVEETLKVFVPVEPAVWLSATAMKTSSLSCRSTNGEGAVTSLPPLTVANAISPSPVVLMVTAGRVNVEEPTFSMVDWVPNG
jgi:hypothetical protein